MLVHCNNANYQHHNIFFVKVCVSLSECACISHIMGTNCFILGLKAYFLHAIAE